METFEAAQGTASFVRAKDYNVLPGVYYETDEFGNKNRFLLMSCTVTNDCYEMIEDSAIAWDLGNIKNYYNTETVYFAVER